MTASDADAANAYWGRTDLERRILDALAAAGKDLDALTIEDLGPADHFHGGGKVATDRLARLAQLAPGTRVLDVGGGLGGPARTLAVEHGCHVTVVDPTESYVRAGEATSGTRNDSTPASRESSVAAECSRPRSRWRAPWSRSCFR
jgi:2-polyprenyl-3-methyl-5-hydroxy-6-metoxy-1,4-benzoquinol methylase